MMRISRKYKIIALVILLLFSVTIIFDPNRPITLKVSFYCDSPWNVPYASSYQVIDDAIKKFQSLHPNVTVVYESGIREEDYSDYLADHIVMGTQPDIYMIPKNGFNLLASTHTLEPLNDYFRNDGVSKTNLFTCALKAGQHFDVQMALPFESNPTLMCMNKSLLASHDISIPDSTWSTSEFYNICEAITSQEDHIFGCVGYTWRNAVNAYNVQLFNEQGTEMYFNTPKMRQALSFISRLLALHSNYTITSHDFDEGNVAFIPMTLAEYRTYRPYPYRVAKYSSFDWKCIELPNESHGVPQIPVETSLFGMSAQSHHKQLAWEFLKLLCLDEEIQGELMACSTGVSVLKSVVMSPETQKIMSDDDMSEDALSADLLTSIMEHGVSPPQFKEYNQMMSLADYYISQAIASDTIELDLSDIQKALENASH